MYDLGISVEGAITLELWEESPQGRRTHKMRARKGNKVVPREARPCITILLLYVDEFFYF
jgi:hypothetical protein